MKILVLEGGNSSEREVSLKSAKSVKQALSAKGHTVYSYDPTNGYDGLKEYLNRVDVVFPIMHGENCEDGVIQIELEKLGFKYLGANSKVSKLCFDKALFKEAAGKMNILMPEGDIVTAGAFEKSKFKSSPFVLKPINGGSSIDAFIVRDPAKLPKGIDEALKRYGTMLLEELVVGVEVNVAVLGDKALPPIEIIPPVDGEFDYENKYNGKSQEICPPQNVSKELQKKVQKIAETIHNGLGVRHLSRSDFIIDKENNIYALEINTLPGMTDQSLYPKEAKAAGIGMEELVDKFVELSLSDG